MKFKEFSGLKKEKVLNITDPEIKQAVFSPTPRDLLIFSLLVFFGLSLIVLFKVYYLNQDLVELSRSDAFYSYQYCSENIPESGSLLEKHCKVVLDEINANNLKSAQVYADLKAKKAFDEFFIKDITMFGVPGLLFIALAALVGLIRTSFNPYFLINLDEKIVLEYKDKKLLHVILGGKTIGRKLFQIYPYSHFMIRSNSNLYVISSVILHRLEELPGSEHIVMDEKQFKEFINFLSKFENVGIKENVIRFKVR